MTTVHWTRPEGAWGPTGEHRAVLGDNQATVKKNHGYPARWLWWVRDFTGKLDAVQGSERTWQAARKAAAAVLVERRATLAERPGNAAEGAPHG